MEHHTHALRFLGYAGMTASFSRAKSKTDMLQRILYPGAAIDSVPQRLGS